LNNPAPNPPSTVLQGKPVQPGKQRPPTGRETALKVLVRVESSDARAKELLDESLKRTPLSPEESGLATELVYGTIRHLARLDYFLNKVCHRPLETLSPWVRNLLRLALYQILELTRVPESAAVDTSVEFSKSYGHEGVVKFVNGVLRELCRLKAENKLPALPADPVAALAISSSHPRWLVDQLAVRYGFDRAREFLEADNQAPPLCLRVHLARVRRDELAGRLARSGYQVEACHFSPSGLRVKSGGDVRRMPGFQEGFFFVQDESSQMVGLLAAPKSGAVVVDVCAAPGGKATHLAELAGPEGKVWAFDRKGQGLEKLAGSAKRLGLGQLSWEVRDALYPREDLLGKADVVVVDAPCSGLGVLRRRVEARWQVKPQNGHQTERQLAILQASSKYLKPGGALVYSTCTISEEENEEVVRKFLDASPQFAFERAGSFLPADLVTSEGFFRSWPGQEGMDGFFGARMRLRS
jgi:16S rRNA (cytosine967-C5)-methyltransferase